MGFAVVKLVDPRKRDGTLPTRHATGLDRRAPHLKWGAVKL